MDTKMDTTTKPAATLPNTATAPIHPATQLPRIPHQTPPPQVRRSKADSLRLADRLKRTMMALTMLGFGAFSVAIGTRLATTNTSTSSNTTTTSTPTTTSSDDGSYFSSGSSNIGTSGSSSSSSSGTVGGSSVS